MADAIKQMLDNYDIKSIEDEENAIKEILQEIVLCGLSRVGFFEKAAFYGGTALRIFYGLDRFSEDLDFSLLKTDKEFQLSKYLPELKKEVNSYGIEVEIEEKKKTKDSAVESAFLKANTFEQIMKFYPNEQLKIDSKSVLKIKFEIDTNPPDFATFEHRYSLLPSPFEITLYDAPSLFAGKMDAIINRNWKNRVKGRDFYDYIFYLQRKIPINLKHLTARMMQRGIMPANGECFTPDEIKSMLRGRFGTVDIDQAKKDVAPFLRNRYVIDVWSRSFFLATVDMLKF